MLRELSGVKRIIIKTGRTDLRRGIDGLASMVRLQYGMDPMENGTLFLFCGTPYRLASKTLQLTL